MKIKKLYEDAILPTRGSSHAAGWDLYTRKNDPERVIMPHETIMFKIGIQVAIPNGFFGGIYARSGLATKNGLRPANCTGVIDSDFRGELIVALHNDTEIAQVVTGGMRIAQLIVQPYAELNLELVDELDETRRGNGGFGSTGVYVNMPNMLYGNK